MINSHRVSDDDVCTIVTIPITFCYAENDCIVIDMEYYECTAA